MTGSPECLLSAVFPHWCSVRWNKMVIQSWVRRGLLGPAELPQRIISVETGAPEPVNARGERGRTKNPRLTPSGLGSRGFPGPFLGSQEPYKDRTEVTPWALSENYHHHSSNSNTNGTQLCQALSVLNVLPTTAHKTPLVE